MSVYAELAALPDRTPFWIVTITGLPYAYASTSLWTGAIDGVTYTIRPWLYGKPKITGERWDLRGGKITPGNLTFQVSNLPTVAHPDGEVLWLLSNDLLTAHETWLMEDMEYSSGVGEIIYCSDHAAFPAAGTLYIDMETVTYTGKTNAGGAVPYDRFDGVARAQYGGLGYAHRIVSTDEALYRSNPAIRTHPNQETGRYATLYEGMIDCNGHPSTTLKTLWRGVLNDFTPDNSATVYSFTARSLAGVAMERKVAEQVGRAEILTSIWGATGYNDEGLVYYIDEGLLVAAGMRAVVIEWDDGVVSYGSLYSTGIYRRFSDIFGVPAAPTPGREWDIYNSILDSGPRCRFQNLSATHDMKMVAFNGELGFAAGWEVTTLLNIPAQSDVIAENPPSRTFHSSSSLILYVQNSSISLATLLPATSPVACNTIQIAIKNRMTEAKEVMKVEAISVDADGFTYLELFSRGYGGDGLSTKSYAIWTEDSGPTWGDPVLIEVKSVVYSEFVSSRDMALYLMTSTDGSGYNNLWDVIQEGIGLAIPATFIDFDSFSGYGLGLPERHHLDEPTPLGEVLRPAMQAEGLGMATVEGQIKLYKIGVASKARARLTISDSCISTKNLVPKIQPTIALLVNRIMLSSNWKISEAEFGREKEAAYYTDAKSLACGIGEVTIEYKGLIIVSEESGEEYRRKISGDLFGRFGLTPHLIGPFEVQRWYTWNLNVGDSVFFTCPRVPNPYTGARGMLEVVCAVHAIEPDVGRQMDRLTLFVPRISRQTSSYAPSLIVAAAGYDAITGWLSVEEYGTCWPHRDIEYFTTGMPITIFQYKSEADTWSGLIQDVDTVNSRINIGAAQTLSDGTPPTYLDRVRYRVWATADAEQKKSAYVADYNTELVGGVSPPFFWS